MLSYTQRCHRSPETSSKPHKFSTPGEDCWSSPINRGTEGQGEEGSCTVLPSQGGKSHGKTSRPQAGWACLALHETRTALVALGFASEFSYFLCYQHKKEVVCVLLNECTFLYHCQGLLLIPPIDVQLSCPVTVLISCFHVAAVIFGAGISSSAQRMLQPLWN